MALLPETHIADSHTATSRRSRGFRGFAESVARSHAARFDNLWWGFVDTYATPHPFRVVDLGTGPGLLVQDLCERFPDAEVFGVDVQPGVLSEAEERLETFENARLIEHDLSSPPIPGLEDAQADLVIASMVLHEMAMPTLALKEACRVLAPGGVLLIYDWMRHPLSVYAREHLDEEGGREEASARAFHVEDGLAPAEEHFAEFSQRSRFTPDDYAWLLEQTGFSVHEVLTRREGRRVMIAARRRER